MAYIDREQVIEAIRKYADIKHNNGEHIEYINGILKSISVINEQPTADVAEVVRCKNCKKAKNIDMFGNYRCFVFQNTFTGIHYCSYGERK